MRITCSLHRYSSHTECLWGFMPACVCASGHIQACLPYTTSHHIADQQGAHQQGGAFVVDAGELEDDGREVHHRVDASDLLQHLQPHACARKGRPLLNPPLTLKPTPP